MGLKYTNINQLKRQVQIDLLETSEDEYLTELLERAEDWAARRCQCDLDEWAKDGELPASLCGAIVVYAAGLYANREGAAPVNFSSVPYANPDDLITPFIKYRGV